MKLGFKRGEKGFTLVELMVVMAIMAVLASIVMPAVTGTKQVSLDTQVGSDGSSVETAVSNYNADSNLAEALTTDNTTLILGDNVTMVTSSQWPELTIPATYGLEFPSTIGASPGSVQAVKIIDENGTVMYETGGATDQTIVDFVYDYNAIDIITLVTEGYLQEEPNGFDLIFSSTKPYHNYLWLVKKSQVAFGDVGGGGRVVELYSLIKIEEDNGDIVTYQKTF